MLLLVACVDPGLTDSAPGEVRTDSGGDSAEDSGAVVIPGDTGGDDAGGEGAGGDLYTFDRIVPIDLTLSDEARASLKEAPYDWVSGDVVVDGVAFTDVGVRLKGLSSFQPLTKKPGLKIDLDHYVDGQAYRGLEELTLNNFGYDASKLREVLSYAAVEAAGLPTPARGFATVTINGLDKGLYLDLEAPSKDWLERMTGSREGRVYEGGITSPWLEEMADFTPEAAPFFDREVGDEVGNADVIAIAAEVATSGDWDARVGTLVDLDAYARFTIAEAWVGQFDGYVIGANNYRVIVPASGGALLVASGLDFTFVDAQGDWARGYSALAVPCTADAMCRGRRAAVVGEVVDAIDAADLVGLRERVWALIEDAATADPMAPVDAEAQVEAMAALDSWVEGRGDEMREMFTE